MMDDTYWAMGTLGWLVMVLFWVLLIVAILWALRELRPQRGTGQSPEASEPAGDDPFAILDRRLASGEIDPGTYDELRDKLAERRLLRR